MANADLVATVRALHVFAGVVWLGLAWAMAWVLLPLASSLQPGTRMDLQPRLGRRMIPFISAASGITLLLGLVLFVLVDPAKVGIGIHIAMTLGIVMFIIAVGVVLPAQKRMIRTMEGGQPPVPKDLGRVVRWVNVNAWLGVATVLTMVLGTHAPALL